MAELTNLYTFGLLKNKNKIKNKKQDDRQIQYGHHFTNKWYAKLKLYLCYWHFSVWKEFESDSTETCQGSQYQLVHFKN